MPRNLQCNANICRRSVALHLENHWQAEPPKLNRKATNSTGQRSKTYCKNVEEMKKRLCSAALPCLTYSRQIPLADFPNS